MAPWIAVCCLMRLLRVVGKKMQAEPLHQLEKLCVPQVGEARYLPCHRVPMSLFILQLACRHTVSCQLRQSNNIFWTVDY